MLEYSWYGQVSQFGVYILPWNYIIFSSSEIALILCLWALLSDHLKMFVCVCVCEQVKKQNCRTEIVMTVVNVMPNANLSATSSKHTCQIFPIGSNESVINNPITQRPYDASWVTCQYDATFDKVISNRLI